METKVRIGPQVEQFVKSLAPEPRRKLAAGIKGLAKDQGDFFAMEAPLSDFYRLRVGGYRVIFAYSAAGDERRADCIFAERRSVVYDLFGRVLADRLLEELLPG
jgi:mRNA-degrading endonuclease RelE of RelBE toxin-antitoxin system